MSDEEVFMKYVEGDERAFNEIYERYQPRIFMGLVKRVGNEDRAEELTQEVFLKIHRYARRFDPNRIFATWVYGITVNLMVNEYKYIAVRDGGTDEKKRRRAISIPRPVNPPNPLEECVKSELEDLRRQALETLSFDQACAYILFENTPMSYEDIAKATGTEVTTIKSRINRARQGIAKYVLPRYAGDA